MRRDIYTQPIPDTLLADAWAHIADQDERSRLADIADGMEIEADQAAVEAMNDSVKVGAANGRFNSAELTYLDTLHAVLLGNADLDDKLNAIENMRLLWMPHLKAVNAD